VSRALRRNTTSKLAFTRGARYVGESVAEPARYFNNNVEQGIALLDVLLRPESGAWFSPRLRTYGEPEQVPISRSSRATD